MAAQLKARILFGVLTAGFAAFGLSACSLKGEPEVLKLPIYQSTNTSCSAIIDGRKHLDGSALKAWAKCLDSPGDDKSPLAPLRPWAQDLRDSEIEAIAAWLDRGWLNEPGLWRKLKDSQSAFDAAGQWKPVFAILARLLEQEGAWTSALAAVSEMGEARGQRLLLALDQLLDPAAVPGAGAFRGLDWLGTPAARAFFERMSAPGGSRSTAEFAQQLSAFLLDARLAEPRARVGRGLLDGIASGAFFRALDELLGADADTVRLRTPAVGELFKVVFDRDAKMMDGVASLFHHMNRPISCFGGAQIVPNGDIQVIRELTARSSDAAGMFLRWTNPLMLSVLSPFCDYPPALSRYYPAFIELGSTPAVGTVVDLLRAFDRQKLLPWVVNLLGETGLDGESGFKRLFPFFVEVNRRDAWEDLILFVHALGDEQRTGLASLVRALGRGNPAWQDWSVAGIFGEATTHLSADTLQGVLDSVAAAVAQPEPWKAALAWGSQPRLKAIQPLPLLELAHVGIRALSQEPRAAEALLRLGKSKGVASVIRGLRLMAEDGRLERLSTEMIGMLARDRGPALSGIELVSERLRTPVRSQTTTQVNSDERPVWRHSWTSADLVVRHPEPPVVDPNHPCHRLDTSVPTGDTRHPRFKEQWDALAACLKSDAGYTGLGELVEFMHRPLFSDGRSLFGLAAESMRVAPPGRDAMAGLTDRMWAALDSGALGRWVSALPFWIDRGLSAGSGLLREAWAPLETRAASLGSVGRMAAAWLRDPQLVEVAAFVREASSKFVPKVMDQSPELGRWVPELTELVHQYECVNNGGDQQRRVAEILSEYDRAITNWDLVDGRPRFSWTEGEFKSSLEPVLRKIGDPRQSEPGRWMAKSLLRVMERFNAEPGESVPNRVHRGTPDYFIDWLHRLSKDVKPILYLYPGEERPRVRLVNSLDRYELILANADFTYIVKENYGLRFLRQIGESWGDEPRHLWPSDVQSEFARRRDLPVKLKDTRDEIFKFLETLEALVGYPKFPPCARGDQTRDPSWLGGLPFIDREVKARLFNLRQVAPVVDETMPGSGTDRDGYMKMLRDLSYEIARSTPQKYRDPKAGWDNNLSVVPKLIRLGLMRQVSRLIDGFKGDEPELRAFGRAFVKAASQMASEDLMSALFTEDSEHRLIWAVIDGIWAQLGTEQGVGAIKSSAFSLVAALDAWPAPVRDEYLAAAIEAITRTVRGNRQWLGREAQWVMGGLASPTTSQILGAMVDPEYAGPGRDRLGEWMGQFFASSPEPLDSLIGVARAYRETPAARAAVERLADQFGRLKDVPEYQALRTGELGEAALGFLVERPGYDSPESRYLRETVARTLESPEFWASLAALGNRTPELEKGLSTLSGLSKSGDMNRFFEMARRSVRPLD